MIFRKRKKHTFNANIFEDSINQDICEVLHKIEYILSNNKHSVQAGFITKLKDCINKTEYEELYRNYNSVEMWGGSGSVCDVYINNKNDYNEFIQNLNNLNILMEKSGNKNRRARSIVKSLIKSLHV